MMVAELRLLSPGTMLYAGEPVSHLPLPPASYVIGRDQFYADIVLQDTSAVSRIHCTLYYEESNGHYYIIDNHSSFGVYVDNLKLEPQKLFALGLRCKIALGAPSQGGALLLFSQRELSSNSTQHLKPSKRLDSLKPSEELKSPSISPAPLPLNKTIFISYSHLDKPLVQNIIQSLEENLRFEKRIWMDELLTPGYSWSEELGRAIKMTDLVLLVLSPESSISPWVSKEVIFAQEHHKLVIPVLIRGDYQEITGFNLAGLQYADLRQDYFKGMERLIYTINKYMGVV